MYYQEHRPDIRLSSLIETYWSATGLTENEKTVKILPDGCVDIIFTLDRTAGRVCPDIVGTMTRFLEVKYSTSVHMFGIRFKPAGITAFTRNPVEEFTDRSVEIAFVETLLDKSFYETPAGNKPVTEIITHIDGYLLRQLPRLYCPDRRIVRAASLLSLAGGQLSPTDAASKVCLCIRHFERQFKSSVGISPKTFARIARFNKARRLLSAFPGKDLLTIAVECGYYDHAHLIKDFKMLSGDTPAKFGH
ncbi:MAG: helix-turn-helix domain-containing protein [Prevotellaceae bacterium]|jgi:AraC-like DNA-binding protein|nr:helix-turn-helix domain-containing protein [Prevotellaceae bacterium]